MKFNSAARVFNLFNDVRFSDTKTDFTIRHSTDRNKNIHTYFMFSILCFEFITAQKMKFFSKYDQIGRKLRFWSRLLKKFLMENFISYIHKDIYIYFCLSVQYS